MACLCYLSLAFVGELIMSYYGAKRKIIRRILISMLLEILLQPGLKV